MWEKNGVPWKYDRELAIKSQELFDQIFPARLVAMHACCVPAYIKIIFKPVMYALLNKKNRQRLLWHSAAEMELPETLAGYGILKEMLPTEMGGDVKLTQILKEMLPPGIGGNVQLAQTELNSGKDEENTSGEGIVQCKDIKVMPADVLCSREKVARSHGKACDAIPICMCRQLFLTLLPFKQLEIDIFMILCQQQYLNLDTAAMTNRDWRMQLLPR